MKPFHGDGAAVFVELFGPVGLDDVGAEGEEGAPACLAASITTTTNDSPATA